MAKGVLTVAFQVREAELAFHAQHHDADLVVVAGLEAAEDAHRVMRAEPELGRARIANKQIIATGMTGLTPFLACPAGAKVTADVEAGPTVKDRRRWRRRRLSREVGRGSGRCRNGKRGKSNEYLLHRGVPQKTNGLRLNFRNELHRAFHKAVTQMHQLATTRRWRAK